METATLTKATAKVTPAHKRKIKKVAVLGSGVMGSRLACHFANIGLEVVLLDIVPFDLPEEHKTNKAARNKIVNDALKATLKANPSPIYSKSFANKITTGNFDDHLEWIKDCDWVLEAIIERLDIKQQMFEKVEKFRTPGTMISSNTSGIPIEMMLEGRSDDFKAHFVGTHFFNPPRYLRLLEIIPSKQTSPEVVDFFMHYGDLFLGKQTVLCKDTPAFIANRVGVFGMMSVFKLLEEMDMTIEEVDSLTGTFIGKPKSATFRTSDVVGLDTLIKVAKGVYENCPDDEVREIFKIPDYVLRMEKEGMLGDKTKKGFYKKSKDANGKRLIEQLDVKTFEYVAQTKPRFETVGNARKIDDLKLRLKKINEGTDKAAEFLRKLSYYNFQYASRRVPEISDELYRLDDAMRGGFGWELGPFENWDVLGVKETVEAMKAANFEVAQWVHDMLAAGKKSFYTIKEGVEYYYDLQTKDYKKIPGRDSFIILDNLRTNKPIYKNDGATIHDLGDGIMNIEFHTKMNTLGEEVLRAIQTGINKAEEEGWKGVVLGNDAPNFSAGANLFMVMMMAINQDWDELNTAIAVFQQTVMRLRYSSIPVVATPHGLTLGGGCEMTMHADASIAAAETYIGLVEVGVGVIPAGGGTKEMVLRASDQYRKDGPKLPNLVERFSNIASAKVATSAHEGFEIDVLNHSKDEIVINQNRVIARAKTKALDLYEQGYTQAPQRTDIEVLGKSALGAFYSGVKGFELGNYASEHDAKIAKKLAYVMAGGDLSANSLVSEKYLLDLEREAFLSLCGEQKTLERIQSVIEKGRPVRN